MFDKAIRSRLELKDNEEILIKEAKERYLDKFLEKEVKKQMCKLMGNLKIKSSNFFLIREWGAYIKVAMWY